MRPHYGLYGHHDVYGMHVKILFQRWIVCGREEKGPGGRPEEGRGITGLVCGEEKASWRRVRGRKMRGWN